MTPTDDKQRPRSKDGLGERVIDDEAVIVNPHGGEILVLNETGAFIWRLLDGEHDVASIVAGVMGEFEVDEDTAQRDVDEFLSRLAERGALAAD